jgi:hypothetical protein
VADRRYADAVALRDTEVNERANGAMYLGGFVVECLLKAAMLEEHPWLQNGSPPSGRSKAEQRIWSLCYRAHDLDEILNHLPRLQRRLAGRTGERSVLNSLKAICGQWTVFARYSPRSAKMSEAKEFLESVKEIRQWAR